MKVEEPGWPAASVPMATPVVPKNPDPVKVRSVPAGPLKGWGCALVMAGTTTKGPPPSREESPRPAGFWTSTAPVHASPGTVALIWVPLSTWKYPAA